MDHVIRLGLVPHGPGPFVRGDEEPAHRVSAVHDSHRAAELLRAHLPHDPPRAGVPRSQNKPGRLHATAVIAPREPDLLGRRAIVTQEVGLDAKLRGRSRCGRRAEYYLDRLAGTHQPGPNDHLGGEAPTQGLGLGLYTRAELVQRHLVLLQSLSRPGLMLAVALGLGERRAIAAAVDLDAEHLHRMIASRDAPHAEREIAGPRLPVGGQRKHGLAPVCLHDDPARLLGHGQREDARLGRAQLRGTERCLTRLGRHAPRGIDDHLGRALVHRAPLRRLPPSQHERRAALRAEAELDRRGKLLEVIRVDRRRRQGRFRVMGMQHESAVPVAEHRIAELPRPGRLREVVDVSLPGNGLAR